MRDLSSVGVSLNSITDQLEIDGVSAFAKAWQSLLDDVQKARTA
jgi:transaldolase